MTCWKYYLLHSCLCTSVCIYWLKLKRNTSCIYFLSLKSLQISNHGVLETNVLNWFLVNEKIPQNLPFLLRGVTVHGIENTNNFHLPPLNHGELPPLHHGNTGIHVITSMTNEGTNKGGNLNKYTTHIVPFCYDFFHFHRSVTNCSVQQRWQNIYEGSLVFEQTKRHFCVKRKNFAGSRYAAWNTDSIQSIFKKQGR